MFTIQTDPLLSIEDICEKLAISRSTLDRLRGLGTAAIAIGLSRSTGQVIGQRSMGGPNSKHPFPAPSCIIGSSPRWKASTVNKWLEGEAPNT